MKRLSLKTKLFLAMFLLVIAFSFFVILFTETYVRHVFMQEDINDAKVIAATMARHIVDPLLIDDYAAIDNYAEETMKENDEIAYIFIEKEGQIVLHTFKEGFPKDLIGLHRNTGNIDYLTVKTGDGEYLDLSAPIHSGSAGHLRIGIDERTSKELIGRMRTTIVLVTIMILGIAFGISLFISRRLTAPLVDLTVSATMVAEGDYTRTAKGGGYNEIGKLAMAFNTMAKAVSLREEELKSVNAEVEEVNVRLHEMIQKLEKTSEELVRSKQDAAVVETARTFLHHLRQPLTYLTMAIELLVDEIAEGQSFDMAEAQKKLETISHAGERLAELLGKFESLEHYKVVEFDDLTRILDIDHRTSP